VRSLQLLRRQVNQTQHPNAPDGPGPCLAALNLPGPPIIESMAQVGGYPAMTATRQAFNPAEGDLPTMERKIRRRNNLMPNPPHESTSPLTRRALLKNAAKAGFASALAPLTAEAARDAGAPRGVIAEENRRPGTTEWQLTFVRSDKFRSAMIEGYCSHTSVRPGGRIEVFLSAQPATDVTIDLYRIGYYGGKGGRHVARLGPFPVTTQPTPPVGEHRLRECQWARATTLAIPADWVSGVYLGKLSCAEHRYQSYIIFVVRDDRPADVLFQTSDTTWQAYNKWPDTYSLYDSDAPVRPWNATTWVSYDRSYGWYPQVVSNALSQGSGEFLLWEFPLCFWLEQHGYDVTCSSNIDTHGDGSGLDRVKCFLSVAHDEYWSLEMDDRVHAAIQKGLNAAFLCGNSVFGVVPLEKKITQAARIASFTGRDFSATRGQPMVKRVGSSTVATKGCSWARARCSPRTVPKTGS
jgi:hypothetical protein